MIFITLHIIGIQKKIKKNKKKPKPRMLIKTVKKWNINTKKSIFIGDSHTDYESAGKMKIKFYYKDNSKLINQIKRLFNDK